MPNVRAILEDIHTLRANKIRESVSSFDPAATSVKLSNFCSVEILRIKPLFTALLEQFEVLRIPEEEGQM
jgi:hypothetical protein